jgi:hypothetical protein
MRMLPRLLLLPLLALPPLAVPPQALAQTEPAVSAQTEPAAVAQTEPAAPAEHHTRMTWEQRFEKANDSHDGHLTLAQARLGYVTVARHFHDIDTDGKGFVTEDDIKAWHKQQRAVRHTGQTSLDDSLRSRPAIHRTLPGQRLYDAPTQPSMAIQAPAPETTVTAAAPAPVPETH